MRTAFIFLLAANLVVLALFQFSGDRSRGAESTVGHEPYQADKVKVVAVDGSPALAVIPPETAKQPVSSVETSPLALPEPAKVSPTRQVPSASLQCLEWSNIADADLERVRKVLLGLKLMDKAVVRKMEKTVGYWVYIPPRKFLADAQKKVGELKALGVGDISILQENTAWRYAISLGVFSTEEAANKYLAQLRDKGVRSALTGQRNRAAENSVVTLKNLDNQAVAEVLKLQKEFSGSEMRPQDCR